MVIRFCSVRVITLCLVLVSAGLFAACGDTGSPPATGKAVTVTVASTVGAAPEPESTTTPTNAPSTEAESTATPLPPPPYEGPLRPVTFSLKMLPEGWAVHSEATTDPLVGWRGRSADQLKQASKGVIKFLETLFVDGSDEWSWLGGETYRFKTAESAIAGMTRLVKLTKTARPDEVTRKVTKLKPPAALGETAKGFQVTTTDSYGDTKKTVIIWRRNNLVFYARSSDVATDELLAALSVLNAAIQRRVPEAP